jgi:hypothetical protein
MTSQMSQSLGAGDVSTARKAAEHERVLERAATAYGLAAIITILFNTALAWIKDAYDPLNSFMAGLSGHHWRTHGVVDVVLFFALGAIFMHGSGKLQLTDRLVAGMVASVIVGGSGLAAWFLLV